MAAMINTKSFLEIVMSNIIQFSRKLKLNSNKPECPDYLLIFKITFNNINDQLYIIIIISISSQTIAYFITAYSIGPLHPSDNLI